jgi:hypothetical protein
MQRRIKWENNFQLQKTNRPVGIKEINKLTIFLEITLGMLRPVRSPKLLIFSASAGNPTFFHKKLGFFQAFLLTSCLGTRPEKNVNLCENLQAIFADYKA